MYHELLKKIPDLRTLNALHSEKLLAYKMEPQSTTPPYSAPEPWTGVQPTPLNVPCAAHERWSPIASPHSSTSSLDSALAAPKSPVRTNSFSSSTSSTSELTMVVDSTMYRPFRAARVDSPTDSGIESGKEHGSCTPTTSVCSSPRSTDEVEHAATDDDMPVLKRALQAPPLVSPNQLMEEAYRHHKKLRAAQAVRAHSPPASSTTDLATAHSTLVGALKQAPKFLNEQQMKRTDLIHNIIMRNEASLKCPFSQQQQQQQQQQLQQQPVSSSSPSPPPPQTSVSESPLNLSTKMVKMES